MMFPRLALAFLSVLLLAHCAGVTREASYPVEPDDARRAERGKLTGEGGLILFGSSDEKTDSDNSPLSVNAYLWRAALDTISFMPLASTDPFGGVIITDWYEHANKPGERFKLHVMILSKQLRSDAVKVRVFRQEKPADKGDWRDTQPSPTMHREFEDIILARARELRLQAN